MAEQVVHTHPGDAVGKRIVGFAYNEDGEHEVLFLSLDDGSRLEVEVERHDDN